MNFIKSGLLLLALFFIGCIPYSSAVDLYAHAAPHVQLGMSKAQVIEILKPSQRGLRNVDKKQSDKYKENGALVEILYFRSGWQDDGLTTDDEFTPYLFKDDKLAAIGWEVLGGPKTQGQAVPQKNIYKTRIIKPTRVIIDK